MFKATIILSSLTLCGPQIDPIQNHHKHTQDFYIQAPEERSSLPRPKSTFLDDPIRNEDVVTEGIKRILEEQILEDLTD